MKIFLQPKYYSKEFVTEVIPKIIRRKAQSEYEDNPKFYRAMDSYLRKNFGVSLSSAIDICANNYQYRVFSESSGELVQNIDKRYKKFRIVTLYNTINDGGLEVKGTKLFDKITADINENLLRYSRIYLYLM